jgi:glycosyltransferase involved in cell wall biosynthesis
VLPRFLPATQTVHLITKDIEMRILFCDYEYPPLGGGGGVINALVAEELAKSHEVTVLTSRPANYPADTIENGVRVVRVPIFVRRQQAAANFISMLAYVPMGIHYGKKLIQSHDYDIINTYFVVPTGPVGDRLSRLGNIPNVVSVLGGDIYDPSKFLSPHRHALLRHTVRKLLRRADRVVGESQNILQYMRQYYTPEIEGTLIPLGIRRPPANMASRSDYGFKENDVLLVTVGRLVARKAIDQLIKMMSSLDNSKAHLLIIGSGPQEERLRELASQQGVAEQVHFLGRVSDDDKFRILRMADIFVSTSQHEGFGLVFLEAMACGLPVVCYGHGGQTDFLVDGETGYVPHLNELASFASHCKTLITDADTRSTMAATNLKRVEELYIDRCAARYETLYQEVIEMHKGKQTGGNTSRT